MTEALATRLPIEWAPQITFDPSSVDEVVEDLLVAGGMSVWVGEPGCGKTTLLLDAMFRIPSGKSWLGKRVEQGSTLLVAAESPASARMRLEAYRVHHDQAVRAFGLVPYSPNLLDPVEVELLVDLIITEGNKLPQPIVLVGIDTVARVMPGANENAGEDMSKLVAACDYIRRETGAHVALVHHLGKDPTKGARGHSSLKGAIDTEVEVTYDRATGVRTLEVTKQRDLGSEGMKLSARFKPVEIGVNRWGKPQSACVVEPVDEPSPHIKQLQREVSVEHAEQALVAGYRKLVEMGVEPTDGITSPRFLPRQLLEKKLHHGATKDDLVEALNRLMSAGRFKVGNVGQHANRTPKKGLVLVEA